MSDTNIDQARFNMIEQQIRPWNVFSLDVLETLTELPREEFAPEKYKSLAFADTMIPLSDGQVMMEPKVEGRLLQNLNIKPTDSALEIGTGSGYLAACLSKLAASVTTVEIHKPLLDFAKKNIEAQHINNVEFVQGDASQGWSNAETYDVIAVTGSIPEYHSGFEKCLKVGGRLFIVCGQAPVMQAMVVTRIKEDVWETENIFELDLPALKGCKVPDPFTL